MKINLNGKNENNPLLKNRNKDVLYIHFKLKLSNPLTVLVSANAPIKIFFMKNKARLFQFSVCNYSTFYCIYI